MKLRVAVAVGICFAVIAAESAASTATITQRSIGGARLGLTADAYRHLFHARGFETGLDFPTGQRTGWTELDFAHVGIAVYFRPHHERSTIITTWNPRYRTAEGIGPCSLLDDVKLTYGKRLKPSKANTQHGQVYAYVLGKNLMLTPNDSPYIVVVGLFDGSEPGAYKRWGSEHWAGYITLSERACHRS